MLFILQKVLFRYKLKEHKNHRRKLTLHQEEELFQKLAETQKTGYLNENFRLFHLRDKTEQEFQFHYHDFHKIVIFISGNVTYFIEGKAYYPKPWDILLVGRYNVHKPLISKDSTYERIVIWIKNEFIGSYQDTEDNISACFSHTDNQGIHLIRPAADPQLIIREILFQLEIALSSDKFAAPLLATTLFLQLLIYINRITLSQRSVHSSSFAYDKQIEEIMQFINHNLSADLSNDALADRFYLSRYHLMHKFKKETGYTLHNYIEQKRLANASAQIKKGIPVMKAAKDSGFLDYSTFLRAFRKKYGISPKEYARHTASLTP